jgi:hypothetical protein
VRADSGVGMRFVREWMIGPVHVRAV